MPVAVVNGLFICTYFQKHRCIYEVKSEISRNKKEIIFAKQGHMNTKNVHHLFLLYITQLPVVVVNGLFTYTYY